MADCRAGVERSAVDRRHARACNAPTWELDYPFSYADSTFVEAYAAFLDVSQRQDLLAAVRCWARLKCTLQTGDYEYLAWQAWKEGFARLIDLLNTRDPQLACHLDRLSERMVDP
jgi:hypothetical protein